MTSDESAKPQSAHKDRNPFDISRRSEEEVAAEIAARLSAWKQARSRSSGPALAPVSPPPQTAHAMVTPGVISDSTNHASRPSPSGAHAFGQQRMPRFGEYAQERVLPEPRTPEQRTSDQQTTDAPTRHQAPEPVASPVVSSPVVSSPVVSSPGALRRAVPAAPSLGGASRAFPFRAGSQRPAKPIPETQIPENAISETPIAENPDAASAADRHIATEPSAEIETPHVESAPAVAPATDQIAIDPRVVDPRADTGSNARRISIPAPVIETWEDEEAAIAAAGIPRLEIPERVIVPMAGRHAAGGGTGWAMSLGAVLLFLGVTLPAALWQQPSDEAIDVVAVPPSDSGASDSGASDSGAFEPGVTAPAADIPAPSAPASGALMEMTAAKEAATAAPKASAPGPFGAVAEQKAQHDFAPYEVLRSLHDEREIAAAPINMPTAAGAAETSTSDRADVAPGVLPPATISKAARPFIPDAGATASLSANPAHVLVAPPGAVKKPAARLKPVASAAVPPATKVAKPAAKPVAQKPKVVKPASQGNPTVEQMFDQLIKTLSNGQPPNPAVQPNPPGTRR